MHSFEMVVEIRVLARQGKTIQEVARETRFSLEHSAEFTEIGSRTNLRPNIREALPKIES